MTVYIAVDYDFPEDEWGPVLERIEGYVHSFRADLRVHLEHNTCERNVIGRLQPSGPTVLNLKEREPYTWGSL